MSPQADLRDVHASAGRCAEAKVSDWLRAQDARNLAEIARTARRARVPFGRHLRAQRLRTSKSI